MNSKIRVPLRIQFFTLFCAFNAALYAYHLRKIDIENKRIMLFGLIFLSISLLKNVIL